MAVENVGIDADVLGHDPRFATFALTGFALAVVLRLDYERQPRFHFMLGIRVRFLGFGDIAGCIQVPTVSYAIPDRANAASTRQLIPVLICGGAFTGWTPGISISTPVGIVCVSATENICLRQFASARPLADSMCTS